MSTTDVPLFFGETQLLSPGNAPNMQSIQSAAAGGAATAYLFNGQISYSLFIQAVAQGKISYISSTLGYTDKNGNWHDTGIPVTFAMSGTNPATSIFFINYATILKSAWDMMHGGQGPALDKTVELRINHMREYVVGTFADIIVEDSVNVGPVTINGVEYNIYGSVETRFVSAQVPVWHVTVPTMVGTATAGLLVGIFTKGVAFTEFLVPALKAWGKGLAMMGQGMSGASDFTGFGSVLSMTTDAATAEETAGEFTLGFTCVGVATFGVMLALAAVPLVVGLFAHYTYHTIQIYNLSKKYDLVWDLPYIYNGNVNTAPVINQNSKEFEQLIGGYRNLSPSKYIKPVPAYGSANFSFSSTSAFQGLGEAFGFTLYNINPADPATTASDYDGQPAAGYGAYAFNLPHSESASNQLACVLSQSPISSSTAWDNAAWKQQTMYAAVSDTLQLKVTVTFDYLTGTHPNNQGQDEASYQSLITIEDV